MKLVLTMVCTREIFSYAQYSSEVNGMYCKRHGIKFRCHVESLNRNRPPHWSKMPAMLQMMPVADWVIWMDADAIVTNFDKSFIPIIEETDKPIIMGKDRNGWNSGVFLVRSCERGEEFLKWVNRQTKFIGKRWEEQAAIMHAFDTVFADDVYEVERQKINAYSNNRNGRPWQEGDFILHTVNMKENWIRVRTFRDIYRSHL